MVRLAAFRTVICTLRAAQVLAGLDPGEIAKLSRVADCPLYKPWVPSPLGMGVRLPVLPLEMPGPLHPSLATASPTFS